MSLALGLILISVILVQAMGGPITGTVKAPDGGSPPAGTVVELTEPGTGVVKGRAKVDPDGDFSLGPVPNGVYILKVAPPPGSGVTQSAPKPVSVLDAPVTGVILRLTAPQIEGTVLKPDGLTPVTGTVKVFVKDNALLRTVPAPGGAFAIGGLPPGSYSLQAFPLVDAPLWRSPRQPVSITSDSAPSISLTLRSAQLWGTAIDEAKNPIKGALVQVAGHNIRPHLHSDHSSAGGFWAIGGLKAGTYVVKASPPLDQPELAPPQPFSVTLPTGVDNPYTLTFSASPKGVSGRVTTNLGDPVDQALIVAHRVDRRGQARTLTGADGGYQLRLSAGLWALTVRKTGDTDPNHWIYPQPPQLVYFKHTAAPEAKTQNFKVVTADANVGGRVKMPDGGAPPFSVTVALRNSEGWGQKVVIAPNNGAFEMRVPHGGYKVVVHPHDRRYEGPPIDPIRVEPDSAYDLGMLTLLEKGAAITGVVRDSDGRGVEGVPVTAWRAGRPDTLKSLTGPDGAYILPVTPGRWRVRPAPGPEQPYLYQGRARPVVLIKGQVAPDIDFELTTADATIEGQLVDESGAPITDVDGWARAVSTSNSPTHNGAPIQDGAFSIYVPGGDYNVVAHLPAGTLYTSGAAQNVSVAAGEVASMTIEVQKKDAVIAGTLWDPRAEKTVTGVDGIVGAWAEENWAATHIDAGNGTYRLPVAAGLWRLGYRIDPGAGYAKLIESKNIPVQSGQTVEVPLPVVRKDGAIAGRVLDPDGAPLKGVPVVAEGIGPVVAEVTLKSLSRADGSFKIPVPYGRYRLGALGGRPGLLKPVEKEVEVKPGQTSDGHVLQFRKPDTRLNGTLTISTDGLEGEALVWAWSEDGGFTKGRFPIIDSTGQYTLGLSAKTIWMVGAVFETETDYWAVREKIALPAGGRTLDLTLEGPHPKPAPVVVTFAADQPQRIDLADGTNILIPAGAIPVDGRVTLRIVPIATLPHQKHANVYRYGYAFIATDEDGQPIEAHFNQDVVIKFSYTEAELARLGVIESKLKPAYFSTTTDHWTAPDSYVQDQAANVVIMQIDHFTDFALTVGAAGDQAIYLPVIRK